MITVGIFVYSRPRLKKRGFFNVYDEASLYGIFY